MGVFWPLPGFSRPDPPPYAKMEPEGGISYWLTGGPQTLAFMIPTGVDEAYVGVYGPDTTDDPTLEYRGVLRTPVFDLRPELLSSNVVDPIAKPVTGGAPVFYIQLFGLANLALTPINIYLLQWSNPVNPLQTMMQPIHFRQDITTDFLDGATKADGTLNDSALYAVTPPMVRFWQFSIIVDLHATLDFEGTPRISYIGQGA